MAARPVLSDELNPQGRRQRQEDEEWLASLELIRELTSQEQQAEEDRLFAASLAGVQINPEPNERRQMAMLMNDFDDDSDENARRSKTTNRTNTEITRIPNTSHYENHPRLFSMPTTTIQNSTIEKAKKCTACMDTAERSDPCVPCGHTYHVSCLQDLFMTATKDESLMPPRCCSTEIPAILAQLDREHKKLFDDKKLEYATVDRLYCYIPTCSTFIPPSQIKDGVGTCPKILCWSQTCSVCKAASHGNAECPKDTDTAAVLNAANRAGWTRCYRCRAVIELTVGCYHMTCRCRAEFCYLCSKPWKNCPCVQWDEERLLTEARERTTRMFENEHQPLLPLQALNQYVRNVANELRDNAECRHNGRWICVRGAGRCEECNHFLPQYLFRCCRCQLMACNRCRRNRF